MSSQLPHTKIKLRKIYREMRSRIPLAYQQQAGHKGARLLERLPCFKHSQHIACYLPVKQEFETTKIIEAIWLAKKKCYLPVLQEDEKSNGQNKLLFVQYNYGDSLMLNRFSILEPTHKHLTIAPEKLDFVIMPLVAFDRKGDRLGTGGGFYDQTFAFKSEQRSDKPKMVGLGYDMQEIEALVVDPWDIPLDYVMTEKEIIVCG